MYSFQKLKRSNKGFSLIELIIVGGGLSILGIIAFPRFLEVVRKAEKVIAANTISNIKFECESNNYLGGNLIFTSANLKVIDLRMKVVINVPVMRNFPLYQ